MGVQYAILELEHHFQNKLYFITLKNISRCAESMYTTIGRKRELDIFIPSKQVGIEYDGSVWHSSEKALNREVKSMKNV